MADMIDNGGGTINDYIAQIDELTKKFPTYGEFKEQDYSDETIETCMGLLYELIEDLGASGLHWYKIGDMVGAIKFNPLTSNYCRLGYVGDNISKVDMTRLKLETTFWGDIGLEYTEGDENMNAKPQFRIHYSGVEPSILESYGLDNTNKTTLPHFGTITPAIATFFDTKLKQRKNYPRHTQQSTLCV